MALLVMSSCDEYLDIKPADTVIPKTIEEFRGLMTSSYEYIPAEQSKIVFRTDEARFNMGAWEQDMASFKDIYLWKDENADKSTLTFNYKDFYTSIFYANHIIAEGAKATGGKVEEVNQLLAEAYMMRAFMHFSLINQYAAHYNKETAASDKGVPLSLLIDLETNYSPATVAEVYAQVEMDIQKGMSLMQVDEYELGKNYRFTKVAGYALQARVALYKQEWAKALNSSKQALLLKSDLEDLSNSDALIPNAYNSKESILALEFGLKANAKNTLYVSDELVNSYDVDDFRLTKYYSDNGSGSFVVEKGGNNEFRCTFRTAEMYLIAAEALAQLNELTDARVYLNQLKAKRLTSDFYASEETRIESLDQSNLITEIAQERFRELAFEGHRWFDLRRTTKKEIVHMFGSETAVLQQADPRYTIRFPQEAINNNPNLSN